MRARLAYKLVAWAVVATLAAFVVDLGLNRLGWANTPAAGVEAVITISLMVFLYLLARKLVMRPLKSVERMAERISSGDLDARVHEDSSAEMALLSGTLNSMAEKLAESYEQLRAHSVTLERTVEERTLDLARERNKLAAIFRGIPDGVTFLSGDGVIIEANPVMDRSFGLKLSGFIGGKVSDLPDAGLRDALSSGTDALCAEAQELEEGGRTYKVGCTSLPGDAGGMSGYIISFYDVTEEKLLEKSKADFISLITHDLKSPLTSILGYSELILDTGAGVLGGQERDYVRSINESGRRLLDMVEQYLDLTKMEAGMLGLDLAPVRPDEIIREALSGLDVQAAQKGVSLEVDIARGLPPVMADLGKMARVVTNLVSNGIKYTPSGGTVSVSGKMAEDDGGRWLEIGVRDTGHGIPGEDLPHIFDRYYRSDWSSSIKGSGLGLAVVKSLVEMHRGEARVESAPGKGSLFMVRIPYTR